MSDNRLRGVIPLLFLLSATATAGTTPWSSLGPAGGSVLGIVFDPLNPAIIYVGAGDGGYFKSTDGGLSWRTINNGLRVVGGGRVTIDPLNPSTRC